MKTLVVILLFFMSWWGWIAFALLSLGKMIPDKWYIALPLFGLATAWGFVIQELAGRYRDKK